MFVCVYVRNYMFALQLYTTSNDADLLTFHEAHTNT